ncbi:MAG: transcriptional regulator [Chloroflexota bacterium]|nr:YafY family transcriptional regulator [Chloroflexota bacterium]NOG66069.1 YafY family transcriptional regulator [Chloroflexota bacterium]GIK63880.1 MAG: transcriptional regulator [Chloroflexota bacterium]
MNRIDRLFNILLTLQTRRRVQAIDLARTFEISERTIYRDMAALIQMGIPIMSLPGQGYELMEGFYLPPLVFTPDEASALYLGATMLAASGNYVEEAYRALEKITVALPPRQSELARQRADIIRFVIPRGNFDLENPYLTRLQQAILEKRVVFIRYYGFNRQEWTEREVEPYFLTFGEGVWYFDGYCRLRHDQRAFRLDRIESLYMRDEVFVERRLSSDPQKPVVEVRVRCSHEMARWMRERQHYAFQQEQQDEEWVIMTYQVEQLAEIKNWLMGWGTAIEVLTPPELRVQIRDEAIQLAKLLT